MTLFSIAALSVEDHLDPFNHDISGSIVAWAVVESQSENPVAGHALGDEAVSIESDLY
jgi:hypothetical protein